MFITFLQEGFNHILDLNAYDHILFVVSICVVYQWFDWKNILILVTAFTLGHSLTLALSSLEIVRINPTLVETLIPITIILSALYNLLVKEKDKGNLRMQYILATFFGLIHGLGFSNYLKSILAGEDSILGPLLAFNIGVELGQIIIVLITVLIGFAVSMLTSHHKWYAQTVLIGIIFVSIWLLFPNIFG